MNGYSPIGIEISGRTVRAAQLRRRSRGWTITACAAFPRLEEGRRKPEEEAARIAGVLARRGFRGTRTVLNVPDDRLISAVIDLPPRASGAPIEQIAAGEMARMYKKDPARMETLLWDLPPSARQSAGHQGMALACAHDDLDPLIDAFESRGFDVWGVVPRISGMVRACRDHLAPAPQATFILDVGWSSATLLSLRERAVVSERTIDGGECVRLRAEVVRAAGVPPEVAELILDGVAETDQAHLARCIDEHAERIAEQVNVSLAYIGHRYGVASAGRLLLLGEHAGLPGLRDRIASLTGAETLHITPVELAVAPVPLAPVERSAATAAGLALLGAEESA